jgi:hypothetical protein
MKKNIEKHLTLREKILEHIRDAGAQERRVRRQGAAGWSNHSIPAG